VIDRLRPAARDLLAAWSVLPRHDRVPARADFDPMAIPHILPIVSLIERVDESEWRMRLAGTEIERRWGRTLTGLGYTDIMAPAAAASTLCEFEAICRLPCASWSMRHLELSSGRRLDVETLRLPLRAADGNVSLIVSCSGELSGRFLHEPDRCREILTVMEQEFLDIGAGIPEWVCAPWPTGGPYSKAAALQPIFQRSASPARNGLTASSPSPTEPGTTLGARRSVTRVSLTGSR